jgi:hypothetical protein
MKRWFAGLVVFLVILLANAVIALAAPPNPYHVLHRDGAIYDPYSGWVMGAPPYYPGTDYAVDFLYRAGGAFAILHRDGGIYDSEYGWNLTSYYPGTNYARALEYLVELSGCWCASDAGWNLKKTESPQHHAEGYPNAYVTITQANRMITLHHCWWTGAAFECGDVAGNVFGNQIILSAGDPGDANSCSWTLDLAGQYYWDATADCYGIQLSQIQSDYLCQGTSAGQEEGLFGVINLKQKYYSGSAWVPCVCPPGD